MNYVNYIKTKKNYTHIDGSKPKMREIIAFDQVLKNLENFHANSKPFLEQEKVEIEKKLEKNLRKISLEQWKSIRYKGQNLLSTIFKLDLKDTNRVFSLLKKEKMFFSALEENKNNNTLMDYIENCFSEDWPFEEHMKFCKDIIESKDFDINHINKNNENIIDILPVVVPRSNKGLYVQFYQHIIEHNNHQTLEPKDWDQFALNCYSVMELEEIEMIENMIGYSLLTKVNHDTKCHIIYWKTLHTPNNLQSEEFQEIKKLIDSLEEGELYKPINIEKANNNNFYNTFIDYLYLSTKKSSLFFQIERQKNRIKNIEEEKQSQKNDLVNKIEIPSSIFEASIYYPDICSHILTNKKNSCFSTIENQASNFINILIDKELISKIQSLKEKHSLLQVNKSKKTKTRHKSL